MQAGESLSFIPIPDALNVPAPLPEHEKNEAVYRYYHLTKELLNHDGVGVRTLERPEESGMVTAKEASYRVNFNDGSYLHVIAFNHTDAEGELLDIGLALGEHDHNGVYQGGYFFEMTGAEVQYAAQWDPSDEEEGETAPWHYSLIDQYLYKDALFDMQFAEEDHVREYATEHMTEWEQEASMSVTERQLGMSWHPPRPEDLEKIATLVRFASPFEPPRDEPEPRESY